MTELISREADVVALGSDPSERFPGSEAFGEMLAADAQGRAGAPMRRRFSRSSPGRPQRLRWRIPVGSSRCKT
jgi:hypothetical protein